MDNQIQARVSPYYRWVIQRLVGRRGKSRSEVLSRIVGEWIEQHEDDLARWGLSVSRFEAESARGPRRVVADLNERVGATRAPELDPDSGSARRSG